MREQYFISVSLLSHFELFWKTRDTLDFKWQGWSNGGRNQNQKKIPGPKINPPKNPMPNFQNLKISRKQNRFGWILYWLGYAQALPQIFRLFWIPQKIPAKLSHPKNSSDHPCHLKFRVPPLGQMKGLTVAYQPVALFCFVLFFVFFSTDG